MLDVVTETVSSASDQAPEAEPFRSVRVAGSAPSRTEFIRPGDLDSLGPDDRAVVDELLALPGVDDDCCRR